MNGQSGARLDRGEDVPPTLQRRMEQAVEAAGTGADIPGSLADAAVACLQEALELCDARAAALPLLAADALITAACEAAAEGGPAGVMELARRFEPAALERLVEP